MGCIAQSCMYFLNKHIIGHYLQSIYIIENLYGYIVSMYNKAKKKSVKFWYFSPECILYHILKILDMSEV